MRHGFDSHRSIGTLNSFSYIEWSDRLLLILVQLVLGYQVVRSTAIYDILTMSLARHKNPICTGTNRLSLGINYFEERWVLILEFSFNLMQVLGYFPRSSSGFQLVFLNLLGSPGVVMRHPCRAGLWSWLLGWALPRSLIVFFLVNSNLKTDSRTG